MALATADGRGRPSVRFVLLKQADERGFVFFGHDRSRKGRELGSHPRAALVFYWNALGRQVRVEGPVERVSDEEADAYWATRPRASRLAAVASRQSAVLPDRQSLVERVRRLGKRYRGRDVPRPREWMGFRVRPEAIEFWTHREHRLHNREIYRRSGRRWIRRLLQP